MKEIFEKATEEFESKFEEIIPKTFEFTYTIEKYKEFGTNKEIQLKAKIYAKNNINFKIIWHSYTLSYEIGENIDPELRLKLED